MNVAVVIFSQLRDSFPNRVHDCGVGGFLRGFLGELDTYQPCTLADAAAEIKTSVMLDFSVLLGSDHMKSLKYIRNVIM